MFSEAKPVLHAIEDAAVVAAIIDVGLPDVMGDELARRCRANRTTLPIILATGYDEHRYAGSLGADQPLRVLGKPFVIPRLLLRLEELGVHAQNQLRTPDSAST